MMEARINFTRNQIMHSKSSIFYNMEGLSKIFNWSIQKKDINPVGLTLTQFKIYGDPSNLPDL